MRVRKTREWMLNCFLAEQRMNSFIHYLQKSRKVDYDTIIRRMRVQMHNWNVEHWNNNPARVIHERILTNTFNKHFVSHVIAKQSLYK